MSRSDKSIRSRKGWQICDAAFCKLLGTPVIIRPSLLSP